MDKILYRKFKICRVYDARFVTQQVTFGKFFYEVACSHISLACRYLCHTSISHAPPHASQAEVSSCELLTITSLLISDCRDHYKATPMDRLDENEKHHQEIVALLDKYAQKYAQQYAQQQITVSIICCMYFHIQKNSHLNCVCCNSMCFIAANMHIVFLNLTKEQITRPQESIL